MRPSGRKVNEPREVTFETGVIRNAYGSCLIKFGQTHVLCTATVDEKVPPFLRGSQQGWVTAEYGMLPASASGRMFREAAKGKQGGRTVEIQRLIARSLRAVVDMEKLGERQIIVDCDVIQADGGTRTASITGGFVAMYIACKKLQEQGRIRHMPIDRFMAAISCGIFKGVAVVDLDYPEDSNAEVDTNFVMDEQGKLIEIQGTAEGEAFTQQQLLEMMDLAGDSINQLIALQKEVVGV